MATNATGGTRIKNKASISKTVRMDRVVYSVSVNAHSEEPSAVRYIADIAHGIHEMFQSMVEPLEGRTSVEILPVRITRHMETVEVECKENGERRLDHRMRGWDLSVCIVLDASIASGPRPSEVYTTALRGRYVRTNDAQKFGVDECSVHVSYRFAPSQELIDARRAELRSELLEEARRQACEVCGTSSIKPAAILYGVEPDGSMPIGMLREAKLSDNRVATGAGDDMQDLDCSIMDFMILEQSAPTVTIRDELTVEWEVQS